MIETPLCPRGHTTFFVEPEQRMSTTTQNMYGGNLVCRTGQFTMNLHGSGSMRNAPHIYRLPVETLARIFELGTHDTDDPTESMDFPMRVATVSKRFRYIACSTPCLWTTLNFYSPRPSWYKSKLEVKYDYTRDRIWLERSRACPLDLIMCYRDKSWFFIEPKHYFRKEHMEHILSIIAPHLHRIRRFTLICDTFAPLHAALLFLAEHGARMKALENLELYRCNEYPATWPRFSPHDMAEPIPLLGGSSAPKLTRVVLAGVHVAWFSSEEPLSNLTSLELTYHCTDVRPSLKDFADILKRSPKLEKLTVIGSGPTSRYNPSPDPFRIQLPFIRTLHFGYYDAQDTVLLLQLIDVPSTAHLIIQDVSHSPYPNVAGGASIMHALDGKFFPRLKSLSLDSVNSTSDAFSACLHGFPGLVKLQIDDISREVLSVLTDVEYSPSTKTLPCPALKSISLRLISDPGVGTLAKARAAAGMPLESILLYCRDLINEQDIEVARQHSHVDIVASEKKESDREDGDFSDISEPDPYELGGAFNDPEFDEMYMSLS